MATSASDRRLDRWVYFCLLTAVVVRFNLPRLFGLLDNDSIVLLIDARRQAAGDGPSMVSTLPVFLYSVVFQLFDVRLWAARYWSVLAGFGTMAVLYVHGRQSEDRTMGLLAALLFAVTPIAVFFGVSELPYGMLTFFGLLGFWMLCLGVAGRGALWGLGAGLAWGAAFLCKTFGAALALPAFVALVFSLKSRVERRRRLWLAPLLAVAGWAVVIAGAVAWRWPTFGWSVFNDYVTDWRFDLAAAIWSTRWFDLVNLHALGLPLLAPGIALAFKRRTRDPWQRLGWWYVGAVLGVFLLNPVNHFPRVLLPAMPVLCYYAGRELAAAWRERRGEVVGPWAIVALLLPAARLLWPQWHLDARPWLVLLETAAALGLFFGFRYSWPRPWRERVSRPLAWLAIGATLFGLVTAYRDLDRVERDFMARLEAVKFSGAATGILGGGDGVHFLMPHGNNVSWLMDLPRDRLAQMLNDGLPVVMRALRLSVAIEDVTDSEGLLDMLRPVAAAVSRDPTRLASPYIAVAVDPRGHRLFDNGRYAVYRLEDMPPAPAEFWPEWSRAFAELDRTGLGVQHPTAARLAVVQRPSDLEPESPENPRPIKIEFTDRPDGVDDYEIRVVAKSASGEVLWQHLERAPMRKAPGAFGVRLLTILLDRPETAANEAIAVPTDVRGVALFEVRALPNDGSAPLWVQIRVPDWW